MKRQQTVLITGATGSVGPRVVRALYQAGYLVRTYSLDSPPQGIFPAGVEVFNGDVNDAQNLRSVMKGVDAIIHLAALLHIVNPSSELKERYERVNIQGTKTAIELALGARVRRFILVSTIAVYGHTKGEVLNESSPACPDSLYAQTKLAAEKVVLNARNEDRTPIGSVLRLGAVYGSRIKGNYQRLVHALARGRFFPVGKGDNRRTIIYDKDVGRAALLVVQHPAVGGKIYNVTDGQVHSVDEIIKTICSILGRTPPRAAIPVKMARRFAGILENSAELFHCRSPITQATIDKYTEDIAVDGSLIQRELGFSPGYNLRLGWQETIQEMRQMDNL